MAEPRERARRDDFSFFHDLRVRWAELDAQGIVFNPNYFMYFDTALTEYMRTIGFPYPDGLAIFGSDIFAVNASADFRDSARFDDLLDVGVRVAQIGRTSLRVAFGVFRGDTLLVEGLLVYVHADRTTKAPMPVPEGFITRIEAFEKVPPTRK